MPCDQIQEFRIDLPKMNEALLKRALSMLGAIGNHQYFQLQGVNCRIAGGKLVVPEGSEHLADVLKRAYSAEVLKYTAHKNGWRLKRKSEFVYEVEKVSDTKTPAPDELDMDRIKALGYELITYGKVHYRDEGQLFVAGLAHAAVVLMATNMSLEAFGDWLKAVVSDYALVSGVPCVAISLEQPAPRKEQMN